MEKITYLQTRDFIIRPSGFDKEKLWIERNDGEGTEISVEKFNEFLEKFFEEVM